MRSRSTSRASVELIIECLIRVSSSGGMRLSCFSVKIEALPASNISNLDSRLGKAAMRIMELVGVFEGPQKEENNSNSGRGDL